VSLSCSGFDRGPRRQGRGFAFKRSTGAGSKTARSLPLIVAVRPRVGADHSAAGADHARPERRHRTSSGRLRLRVPSRGDRRGSRRAGTGRHWRVVAEGERSHLEAESRRVAAQTGPARFLAAQLGTDAETVIRWLVTFLVLLIDPSAVVLTIAAARGRRPAG